MTKRKRWLLLVGILLVSHLSETADTPNALRDDLIQRRKKIAEAIGKDAMLILFSNQPKHKTGDVYYEFRQNNNLYYLTGIGQEDTMLVLLPGKEGITEFIFVKDRNPRFETWEGKILSHDEVKAISGIQGVYSNTRFNEFIDLVFNQRPFDANRYLPTKDYDKFFETLRAGKAQIYFVFEERSSINEEPGHEMKFANKLKERFLGISIRDAWPEITKMRQVKSDYEMKMMREVIDITADGHFAAMDLMKPGIWEYEVEAAIEAAYKKRNAFDWGFPSIVASGPNATTLHYQESSRQAAEGELMLIDIGAEYQYYSADITRTFPVSGRYSPEQAEIYRIVYDSQQTAIEFVKPGITLRQVHQKAVDVAKQRLKQLGLITDTEGEQYRTWYLHGTCHWLGMDVHDTGVSLRPLEPGMVFTVEPGIYIRADALDNLPPTPENQKFKEAVRPAFEKYKNIGVRIEDDVLVTDKGSELLSKRIPRKLEDVEQHFQKK